MKNKNPIRVESFQCLEFRFLSSFRVFGVLNRSFVTIFDYKNYLSLRFQRGEPLFLRSMRSFVARFPLSFAV